MNRNLKMPWSMQDTAKNMECIRDIMIKKVRLINKDGKAEEDVREVNFDFNRVKEALGKQIPMKPEYLGDEEDGQILCLSCENDLWDLKECGFNNCPYCGQKLDWEVEHG